jgi:hypothetical protein
VPVRVALVGIALALVACSGDPPPSTVAHHPPPSSTSVGPHGPTTTEALDTSPATLVHLSGVVRVDSGPAVEGASLERAQRLELEDGAEATIELSAGDRVTLYGPVLARVGEQGAAGMELVHGSALVRLSPGPAGPRSPLRVATPESTVELIGPGEVFVVADRSGATWTVVMAGMSRVANGDADARHHARLTELAAPHALIVGEQPAEPTDGPTRLDDARTTGRAIFTTTTPLEPARLAERVTHAATNLDTALGWLEAEARHGRDLTDEHRAAVAAGNGDEAMRLQAALVGHAQELHALRDTARLRWERLSALVLEQAVPQGGPDPLAPRRDRAASLLGLE